MHLGAEYLSIERGGRSAVAWACNRWDLGDGQPLAGRDSQCAVQVFMQAMAREDQHRRHGLDSRAGAH